MDWAKLLLALATLFSQLLTWAREKQLLDAGQQQALASIMRVQADALERSNKVREEISKRNATVPQSSSLPDDGFRRD